MASLFPITLKHFQRLTRHNGGNRMFIDKLRMAIPAQKQTKIVKPRDNAREFDAVHQENRQRNFVLSDVI